MANLRSPLLVLTLGASLLALGACDIFKSSNGPKLPGTRIPVMTFEDEVAADPALAGKTVTLPAPYVNADWPQAGGDSSHAMQHLAVGDSPREVWRASAGEGSGSRVKLITQPVVADGKIFALDTEGVVSALSLANGGRVWKTDLTPEDEDSEAGFGGGISYADGKLFVSTGFGLVVALDARTGAEVWRKKLIVPFRAAPAIAGGAAIVTTHDNQVFALDTATGEEKWNYQSIAESAGILGSTSAAVVGDAVVVPFTSGEVTALRLANGRVQWSDSLTRVAKSSPLAVIGDVTARPVIDRGMVFAVSHAGRMAAIDLRTGARVWTRDAGGTQTPWVAGDYVYLVTSDAQLLCLERADGRIRWASQLTRYEDPADKDGPIEWSGPVLAGDRLILTSSLGDAIAVSPYTGKGLGKIELPAKSMLAPVVADQTLYFLLDDGDIVALR